jgi:hypothetical protein
MSEVTTTAVVSAPVKAVKKQWNVGVSQELKTTLAEMQREFLRPSVTVEAGVPATEPELLNALFRVAMANRFTSIPQLDEEGEPVFDGDGMPEMVQVDNLLTEITAEFDQRKPGKLKVSKLEMQFRNMAAKLNLDEEWLNARLAECALVNG